MSFLIKKIVFQKTEYDILIGRNSKGNEEIIKMANLESIWMHFSDHSGPHIILQNNGDYIRKKDLKTVSLILFDYKKSVDKKSSVVYCKVKDITLTKIQGCVITKNTKIINF